MTHVDVESSGVGEKPAIAGWLIVPPMVQIQDPATSNVKDVIPDALSDPGGRVVRPILVDQKAIFGFEPENTIQHSSQLLMTVDPVPRGATVLSLRQAPRPFLISP